MPTIEELPDESDPCNDTVHTCFCGKKAAHATGSDQVHQCSYTPCGAQWKREGRTLVLVRPPRTGTGGVARHYRDEFMSMFHG